MEIHVGVPSSVPRPSAVSVRSAAGAVIHKTLSAADFANPLRTVPFGAPEIKETPWGVLAYALEKGVRDRVEDGRFETPDGSAFGVVDGMGRLSDGPLAAHILANSLRGCLMEADGETAVREAVTEAKGLMDDRKRRQEKKFGIRLECGAAFACARIREGRAHVAWSGDCQAVLARRGAVVRMTAPHCDEFGRLSRYVSSDMDEYCVPFPDDETWDLEPGDLLLLGSDGLWKNVFPGEACSLLADVADPARAVSLLGAAALRTMMYGSRDGLRAGDLDNITVQAFLYAPRAA